MNWVFIIFFSIAVIALIVFLIIRNLKDEEVFEKQLNNDYPKSKDEEGDTPTEEALK